MCGNVGRLYCGFRAKAPGQDTHQNQNDESHALLTVVRTVEVAHASARANKEPRESTMVVLGLLAIYRVTAP